MAAGLPTLNPDVLRPYASFAFLVYTGPDVSLACEAAMAQLRRMAAKESSVRAVQILASGLPEGWVENQLAVANDGGDESITAAAQVRMDAVAYRVTKTASWAKLGSEFLVSSDELSIAFQRDHLVAVHCSPGQVDSLQRWLDSDPRPAFRRVRGAYLQLAFLQGEARGLWLKGTHRRQAAKATRRTSADRRSATH